MKGVNSLMQKQGLTINEAAEYSGIGRNTLRALIKYRKYEQISPIALANRNG